MFSNHGLKMKGKEREKSMSKSCKLGTWPRLKEFHNNKNIVIHENYVLMVYFVDRVKKWFKVIHDWNTASTWKPLVFSFSNTKKEGNSFLGFYHKNNTHLSKKPTKCLALTFFKAFVIFCRFWALGLVRIISNFWTKKLLFRCKTVKRQKCQENLTILLLPSRTYAAGKSLLS